MRGMKDYYEKDIIKKCDVCGNVVADDSFGNGTCERCGWVQGVVYESHPDIVTYPNMVSLNKAKMLYSERKPFTPSLEDFLDALFMYSEVVFNYANEVYEVFLSGGADEDIIVFASERFRQEFCSRDEFKNRANIDGKLLKDIWRDVTNANYMQ